MPEDAADPSPRAGPPPLPDARLSIDDEGRFLHDGVPVSHAGLLAALWRGLGAGPGGAWQVRIGREVAGVEVIETPWRVRGVAVVGAPPERVDLLLNDGTVEPLAPLTLQVGRDGVLRCRVKAGDAARFTRAGQLALGALLEPAPAGSDGWSLTLGGARHVVTGAGGA